MLSRSIGTGEHPHKAQALPDACRFLLPKGWRSGMAGDGPESLGINPAVATAARMYDYWLGGHDNFAADRIAALEVEAVAPEALWDRLPTATYWLLPSIVAAPIIGRAVNRYRRPPAAPSQQRQQPR
jgi:hypothetical protein